MEIEGGVLVLPEALGNLICEVQAEDRVMLVEVLAEGICEVLVMEIEEAEEGVMLIEVQAEAICEALVMEIEVEDGVMLVEVLAEVLFMVIHEVEEEMMEEGLVKVICEKLVMVISEVEVEAQIEVAGLVLSSVMLEEEAMVQHKIITSPLVVVIIEGIVKEDLDKVVLLIIGKDLAITTRWGRVLIMVEMLSLLTPVLLVPVRVTILANTKKPVVTMVIAVILTM